MDWHWQGKFVDGAALYSPANYHDAVLLLPIAFLFSLVVAVLIRETHCQRKT